MVCLSWPRSVREEVFLGVEEWISTVLKKVLLFRGVLGGFEIGRFIRLSSFVAAVCFLVFCKCLIAVPLR